MREETEMGRTPDVEYIRGGRERMEMGEDGERGGVEERERGRRRGRRRRCGGGRKGEGVRRVREGREEGRRDDGRDGEERERATLMVGGRRRLLVVWGEAEVEVGGQALLER